MSSTQAVSSQHPPLFFQAKFISVFFRTAVDDRGLIDRGSHGPVNDAVFLEVDVFLAVEGSFPAVAADVLDCLEEEILVVNSVLDDIMVRPGVGVGFGEGPVSTVNEFFYIRWESCHDFLHPCSFRVKDYFT